MDLTPYVEVDRVREVFGEFGCVEFSGGHMYLVDQAQEILDLIGTESARGAGTRISGHR